MVDQIVVEVVLGMEDLAEIDLVLGIAVVVPLGMGIVVLLGTVAGPVGTGVELRLGIPVGIREGIHPAVHLRTG